MKLLFFSLLAFGDVLFVGGIFNECALGVVEYFGTFRRIVHAPEFFWPSSRQSVPETVRALHRKIRAHEGSLMLVAHSKGAAEALILVLQHPELLRTGRIHRLLLIQGAFGGSPLARASCFGLMTPLRFFFREVLVSMEPENTRTLLQEAYKSFVAQTSGSERENFSKKIFYLRSAIEADELSSALLPIWRLCGDQLSHLGQHDGILLTEEEKFDAIGQDLGVVQFDHFDLVMRGVGMRASEEKRSSALRHAFMQVLED